MSNITPFRVTSPIKRKLVTTGERGSKDGELNYPCGITFDPINQQIIVSDKDNHLLQFFNNNHDLSHLFTLGGPEEGNELGQFNYPHGLAIQPHTNHLLVCDEFNHRVQVLSSSSSNQGGRPRCKPLYAIGLEEGKGVADGQFNRPHGVCCSPKGEMMVSDTRNHRVQLFDPAGRFLTKFGTNGDGDAQFDMPFDVCYLSRHLAPSSSASSLLLVADHGNDQVSIWSGADSGHPQHIFNLQCNDYTRAICVDLNGFVYASVGSSVCIFDPRNHYTMLQKLHAPNYPTGLCVDDHNTLMVTYFGNNHQVLFFDFDLD